ncbi:MAG TPA: hypothetical protein DC042_07345 [Bacteroidales bacterium]|nr:hypothetical protein [Bacteroidales bacterium]
MQMQFPQLFPDKYYTLKGKCYIIHTSRVTGHEFRCWQHGRTQCAPTWWFQTFFLLYALIINLTMKAKFYVCLVCWLALAQSGTAQRTPVFGAFAKHVDWFHYDNTGWSPGNTIHYTYGYVGEYLVVLSEEVRTDTLRKSRKVCDWIYNTMPLNTSTVEQIWQDTMWVDKSRSVFEWDLLDDRNAYSTKYFFQQKSGNDWLTVYGSANTRVFDGLGRWTATVNLNFNPETGRYDTISRFRYAYDLYGHQCRDTVEKFEDGAWKFSSLNEYWYPQNVDSREPDSVTYYHWVDPSEIWAVGWWKPDFRYIYRRDARKISWSTDKWDEIAFHWDTLYRSVYEYDEPWNMTLNTREKWKENDWDPGLWRMDFGLKWEITWTDGFPVERNAWEWVSSGTGVQGFWNPLSRERFSNFWSAGIPDPEPLASNIKAWPNPFTGFLRIELPENRPGPALIQVTDIAGRTLYQKENPEGSRSITLDLNNLPPGPYLLRILTRNSPPQTLRIIRQ